MGSSTPAAAFHIAWKMNVLYMEFKSLVVPTQKIIDSAVFGGICKIAVFQFLFTSPCTQANRTEEIIKAIVKYI